MLAHRHGVAMLFAAAVAGALVAVPAPGPVAAAPESGRRLLLACSRGAVPVCRVLLDNPRVAPGVRAAIEQVLAEIEAALVACERGDREACGALATRWPELPRPVLDLARERAR